MILSLWFFGREWANRLILESRILPNLLFSPTDSCLYPIMLGHK